MSLSCISRLGRKSRYGDGGPSGKIPNKIAVWSQGTAGRRCPQTCGTWCYSVTDPRGESQLVLTEKDVFRAFTPFLVPGATERGPTGGTGKGGEI